jgi:hypothetical protein
MADAKKPSAPIMDVAHPGKTAPSPNSKSVIVTHRPMVADPMVMPGKPGDDSSEGNDEPKHSLPSKGSSGAPKLRPLSPAPPEETKPEPAAEKPVEPAEESPKPVAKTEPEPIAKTDTEPAGAPAKIEEKPAAVPQDATQVDPKLPADPAALEVAEQIKHDAEIDKLVEGKQYYLPINTREKRRTKRVIALGVLVSLVLLVAWADIALDASLIKIPGVKPVTHFFSN